MHSFQKVISYRKILAKIFQKFQQRSGLWLFTTINLKSHKVSIIFWYQAKVKFKIKVDKAKIVIKNTRMEI